MNNCNNSNFTTDVLSGKEKRSIKKIFIWVILSWCRTKYLELILKELMSVNKSEELVQTSPQKKPLVCKSISLFNVVVPGESKSIVATCNWAGAVIQMQTTRDAVNGGTLPCVWWAHVTSGDSVTKQPHLSPQHYELNDRQHMLDRTRVSVSKWCSKAMKNNKLGGSRFADLTAPHSSDPLFIMQEYMANLVSKGREGGREN